MHKQCNTYVVAILRTETGYFLIGLKLRLIGNEAHIRCNIEKKASFRNGF